MGKAIQDRPGQGLGAEDLPRPANRPIYQLVRAAKRNGHIAAVAGLAFPSLQFRSADEMRVSGPRTPTSSEVTNSA
jgi:hypothetical protein